MRAIIDRILRSDYVFRPKGESVRAAEITVIAVAIDAILSEQFPPTDWEAWLTGLALASAVAAASALKGALPARTPTPTTPGE